MNMYINKLKVASVLSIAAALLFIFALREISPVINPMSAEKSYASTICPDALVGRSYVALPSKATLTRLILPKSLSSKPAKSMLLNLGPAPVYIDGSAGSAAVYGVNAAGQSFDALCQSPTDSQWFVGGTSGVSSLDTLEIINSGLSPASVLINPYTERGPLTGIPAAIPATSAVHISLSSLAPGESSVVFNVVTQSGATTSYLLDQRKSGLSNLGASYVASTDQPRTSIEIGGLINSLTSGASAQGGDGQRLRLFVPGNIDAHISGLVVSSDGEFVPIGLSDRIISHQKVVDLALPTGALTSPYGLILKSDQPLFASAITQITSSGGSDFAWANSLSPLSTESDSPAEINFAANTPQIFFMGNQISVKLRWKNSAGETVNTTVSGQGEVTWTPPSAVGLLWMLPTVKSPIYASAIIVNAHSSKGGAEGFSYIPITSHEVQTGSPLPRLDIRALTHQSSK